LKQAVQITILGQQYTVRSEFPPEEVTRVAAFVNEWVAEAAAGGKSADSLNTAVLALLNLGGAYLRLQESGAGCEVTQRLRDLLDRLEQVVPQPALPGEQR
jgi:cell division protein ZapA